jgi:hypothetical protein
LKQIFSNFDQILYYKGEALNFFIKRKKYPKSGKFHKWNNCPSNQVDEPKIKKLASNVEKLALEIEEFTQTTENFFQVMYKFLHMFVLCFNIKRNNIKKIFRHVTDFIIIFVILERYLTFVLK